MKPPRTGRGDPKDPDSVSGAGTHSVALSDREGGPLRNAVWTLGAPRRGELWETTAIPEIRAQAAAIVEEVLAPAAARLSGASVRRALSTHFSAAAAFRSGVDRMLKVRAGAEKALHRTTAMAPGFAAAHAALALIGHERGADVDVPRALADARRVCTRVGGTPTVRRYMVATAVATIGRSSPDLAPMPDFDAAQSAPSAAPTEYRCSSRHRDLTVLVGHHRALQDGPCDAPTSLRH